MTAAPDSFAAHEAFAEVVRLYVKAGHPNERARQLAREVLEGFVAGYGIALGPLSPPAAAPPVLSRVESATALAKEMGGRTPSEVVNALAARGLELARVSEEGPVVDSGPVEKPYQIPQREDDPSVSVSMGKLKDFRGEQYEFLTVSQASEAVRDARVLSVTGAHAVVGRLNEDGIVLVRRAD